MSRRVVNTCLHCDSRPRFLGYARCAECIVEYANRCQLTPHPHHTCPACETELAAHTPGTAVAIARTKTPNLRVRSVEIEEIEEW